MTEEITTTFAEAWAALEAFTDAHVACGGADSSMTEVPDVPGRTRVRASCAGCGDRLNVLFDLPTTGEVEALHAHYAELVGVPLDEYRQYMETEEGRRAFYQLLEERGGADEQVGGRETVEWLRLLVADGEKRGPKQ
jgi:hypothetical protein